jgi:hypothetical protein
MSGSGAKTANAAKPADVMEQRVMAFAEQLGRMVGTIQAKAEGWMDRETLGTQVASVRDGAANLLNQLAVGATTAAKRATGRATAARKKPTAAARTASMGRSGGAVDAPGKKHRKRTAADPGVKAAERKAVKARAVKTMAKTNRLRGRG